MADVRINLGPLRKLSDIPRSVHKQWAVRYRAFAADRFIRFSRGGGNWKPLRPSTIRRRRKGKGTGPIAAILFDTGTLFGALSPVFGRKPGQFEKLIKDGIRVGYGGPGKHSKGMTVAGIAEIHQEGRGAIPARKIIVDPPQKVLDGMAEDVVRYWKKVSR